MSASTISPKYIKSKSVFGHIKKMHKEGINFYINMYDKYGEAICLRAGHKIFYFLNSPSFVKSIFIDHPDIFIKGKQYDSLRTSMGNGLLTSEGEDWQRQRRLLNPIFGKEGIDKIIPLMYQEIDKFVGLNFDKEKIYNVSDLMSEVTLNIALAAFFGNTLGEDDKKKLSYSCNSVLRIISKKMSRIWSIPQVIPTAENKEFKKSQSFILEIVKKIYADRKNSNKTNSDLLQMLIDSDFTVEEVFDQTISFIFAGHETTALTLGWIFYLLGENKEYQEKISEEFVNIKEKNNKITLFNQAKMTNAIISEVMRLYPSGWIISRDIKEDVVVDGYSLKKGRIVAISPLILHRSSKYWIHPNDFIPERFLEGTKEFQIPNKNTYIPFSIGRRNCIGSRFAQLEMAFLCLEFFAKYDLELISKDVKMKGFVTLKTNKPILARLIKKT